MSRAADRSEAGTQPPAAQRAETPFCICRRFAPCYILMTCRFVTCSIGKLPQSFRVVHGCHAAGCNGVRCPGNVHGECMACAVGALFPIAPHTPHGRNVCGRLTSCMRGAIAHPKAGWNRSTKANTKDQEHTSLAATYESRSTIRAQD